MGPEAAAILAGGGLAAAALTHLAASRAETRAEARFPPQGEVLDVAGARVHRWIAGSGPDVVLIHGASGNLRDFTFALAPMLARDWRVIAIDRPGHGHSGRGPGHADTVFGSRAESPFEQAALLSAVAAEAGADRPIVLGHSYGGSVALAWGLTRPAAALVLLAPVSLPWDKRVNWFYSVPAHPLGSAVVAPLLAAYTSPRRIRASTDHAFRPQRAPQGYVDHIGAGLTLRRAALRANGRQVTALRGHIDRMTPLYARLDLPVEILHGAADETVPLAVHGIPLARRIRGARLTVLDGVGHMPHHVRPDAVAAALDRAGMRAGLRKGGAGPRF